MCALLHKWMKSQYLIFLTLIYFLRFFLLFIQHFRFFIFADAFACVVAEAKTNIKNFCAIQRGHWMSQYNITFDFHSIWHFQHIIKFNRQNLTDFIWLLFERKTVDNLRRELCSGLMMAAAFYCISKIHQTKLNEI